MIERTLSFAIAASLVLVVAGGARAQELEDRSLRIAANLGLGLAGELDSFVGDAHGEADLDASIGFDLRAEAPVLDFLVIGGLFQFMSYETDTMSSEREETFAFDGYLRARWVFEAIPSTLFVEPYVLLPLGLTLAALPDEDGSGDDVWVGWNTGALVGAQFLHASGFGGYVEVGWRHAEIYTERNYPVLGNVDFAFVANELALNFGFVYAFDAR